MPTTSLKTLLAVVLALHGIIVAACGRDTYEQPVATPSAQASQTASQTSTSSAVQASSIGKSENDNEQTVLGQPDGGLGQMSGGAPVTDTATSNTLETDVQSQACIEAPSSWICDSEQAVGELVNSERQKAGLNALRLDAKASYVARLWSTEQAESGAISHAWFSSGEWRAQYRQKFGEDPRVVSENVAMVPCGSDPQGTALAFMNGWMNSAGHRANILRGGLGAVAVGIAQAGSYCYGTQNFGN